MPKVVSCQGRLLGPAYLRRVAAAGSEPARPQRPRQVRRQAWYGVKPLSLVLVELGDGSEQCLGIGMVDVLEQAVRGGALDDFAGVHHHRPVSVARDDPHVVGDKEDGHVEPALQVVDQGQDLGLNGHVERRCRLVGDQQLGLTRERHGDHDPLAEAPGQLVRVIMQPLCRVRHAHEAEDFGRPGESLLLGHPFVEHDALGDLAADVHRRVEGGQGVLEDHPDIVAPDRPDVVVGHGRKFLAAERDGTTRHPAAGREEAHDRGSGHRLAAAGLPDEADRLTWLDFETDPVHRLDDPGTELYLGVQVLYFQEAHAGMLALNAPGGGLRSYP